ncbi:hypothetical protein OUZ56_031440 [Daphnia magna]|uniref:Uncharacterized protein n=1 Tax=Daphnia magna TaxID=35525 RepID=A0ABQ9ZUC2_9CRUS|nr:hypothetical protein OUZ56_031440 [Daphnia magna]
MSHWERCQARLKTKALDSEEVQLFYALDCTRPYFPKAVAIGLFRVDDMQDISTGPENYSIQDRTSYFALNFHINAAVGI